VSRTDVPAHVPPELVREVDLFDLKGGAEDVHLAWKRVQEANPPIFYTPCCGGYWVLARAELVSAAFPDYQRFSSNITGSIPPLPPGGPRLRPFDADPPEHGLFRSPINKALSPRRVLGYAEDARKLAVELTEGLKSRGECEFIADFAMHLPMRIFLGLVKLPEKDRIWLIERAACSVRDPDPEVKLQNRLLLAQYLAEWLRRRRAQPEGDLLSDILALQIDGRPISDDEAVGTCILVMFGGLDTVASTMGFIARYLAENPGQRRELTHRPQLIPKAIEELLRRHSIPTVPRVLTQDIELDGVLMKAGDKVMLSTFYHGLDDGAWPEPLKVDFTRSIHEHFAFGKGVHKCPGANLARAELRIFLEEWLRRIPEFSIKPGDHAVTVTGQTLGMTRLPLVWPVS
jgi:cytochrome P450